MTLLEWKELFITLFIWFFGFIAYGAITMCIGIGISAIFRKPIIKFFR